MLKNKINWTLTLQAALCCLLWGTAFPTLKLTYKALEMPADDLFNRMVLAGMRFLMSGCIIIIYLMIKDRKFPKLPKEMVLGVGIFGLLNTTLQYMFFYMGVANTSAIKGVLIDTSKPLIIVILAHFYTHDDKFSLGKTIGLFFGFLGILVANMKGTGLDGLGLDMTFIGEGSLIIASLVYGIAVLYGKKLMLHISSVLMNGYQFMMGAFLLLLVGLIGAGGFHLQFNMQSTLLLIYSAFLSAIAFVIWYQLIHRFGASVVAIYVFLIPVFGSIISSVVFVDEQFTLNIFVSLILVSIGIIFVNKKPKRS